MKTRETTQIDELVTLLVKSFSSAGVEKVKLLSDENGYKFQMMLSDGVVYRKQVHFMKGEENE